MTGGRKLPPRGGAIAPHGAVLRLAAPADAGHPAPAALPPGSSPAGSSEAVSTVYCGFLRLRDSGAFATLNHHLPTRDREASPSAAVIDSQSVKEHQGRRPRRPCPCHCIAARLSLRRARLRDNACAGERVATATRITVEIARKQPEQVGFTAHPRRRVVERFFPSIGRNRRLAKDFEGTVASAFGAPPAGGWRTCQQRPAPAGGPAQEIMSAR